MFYQLGIIQISYNFKTRLSSVDLHTSPTIYKNKASYDKARQGDSVRKIYGTLSQKIANRKISLDQALFTITL